MFGGAFRKLLPTPKPKAFARRVVSILKEELSTESVEFDEEAFSVKADAKIVFLHNYYTEYRLAWPWQRSALFRRIAANTTFAGDGECELGEARSRLLPGVRHAHMFDSIGWHATLEGLKPHKPPPGIRLGPWLRASIFQDFETNTSLVSSETLAKWGLSFDAAMAIALENLGKQITGGFELVSPGVYLSTWQDCYDTARILIPGVFAQLELSGDPVVIAANWNRLIVTGANDAPGLTSALQLGRRFVDDEPRPTSTVPIVRRGGEWVEFVLPRGHEAEPHLRANRVLELDALYADQKEQLDKIHQRDATDVFVASYRGTRSDEADEHSSYCAWSNGIWAWLPRTETVVFVAGEVEHPEIVARIDWAIVRQHCSDMMQVTDHALPRYEVDEFPSGEQLEAMRHSQSLRGGALRAER